MVYFSCIFPGLRNFQPILVKMICISVPTYKVWINAFLSLSRQFKGAKVHSKLNISSSFHSFLLGEKRIIYFSFGVMSIIWEVYCLFEAFWNVLKFSFYIFKVSKSLFCGVRKGVSYGVLGFLSSLLKLVFTQGQFLLRVRRTQHLPLFAEVCYFPFFVIRYLRHS